MKKNLLAVAVAVAAFGATNANAYVTFFGEDLNSSATVPLASTPNASAAETAFKSSLTGVGTETFETQTPGATTPLALTFPGAGIATLNGGGSVETVTPGSTNSVGRYSIPSASSSNFWEANATGGLFTINFSQAIAAFGFYGIDIGDFGGALSLTLTNGTILDVGNTEGSSSSTDGSVLFYGLIAAAGEEFTSVSFNSSASSDFFGFDNFTIGTRAQVCTGPNCGSIPEPATLGLLGLGLIGLAAARRRKTV